MKPVKQSCIMAFGFSWAVAKRLEITIWEIKNKSGKAASNYQGNGNSTKKANGMHLYFPVLV